eukprot:1155211-Pelagomonas_calceolata.AAC.8
MGILDGGTPVLLGRFKLGRTRNGIRWCPGVHRESFSAYAAAADLVIPSLAYWRILSSLVRNFEFEHHLTNRPHTMLWLTRARREERQPRRPCTTLEKVQTSNLASMKTERHCVAGRMITKALSKSPWGA